MFVEQSGAARNNGNAAAATMNSGRHQDRNMTPMARKVLTEMNNAPQNNEGLNVRQIALGLRVEYQDALKACDELLGMGAIYTTVDDFTFAVLE